MGHTEYKGKLGILPIKVIVEICHAPILGYKGKRKFEC
jgi:hypothetical protein